MMHRYLRHTPLGFNSVDHIVGNPWAIGDVSQRLGWAMAAHIRGGGPLPSQGAMKTAAAVLFCSVAVCTIHAHEQNAEAASLPAFCCRARARCDYYHAPVHASVDANRPCFRPRKSGVTTFPGSFFYSWCSECERRAVSTAWSRLCASKAMVHITQAEQ